MVVILLLIFKLVRLATLHTFIITYCLVNWIFNLGKVINLSERTHRILIRVTYRLVLRVAVMWIHLVIHYKLFTIRYLYYTIAYLIMRSATYGIFESCWRFMRPALLLIIVITLRLDWWESVVLCRIFKWFL